MNNKGQLIMIRLLIFVMMILISIAMVPALRDILDEAQGSNALNCQGFIDRDASANQNYSYNASLNTEELSCVAIDLYLPYILLVILIGGVTNILLKPQRQDEFQI